MLAACERVQLLAPSNSTITVSAPSRVLPFGGSTEVTAFVTEQGGTPVQNGTVVRFSATLGTVSPVEVETRNGLALTTFVAGTTSGVADVRATSGGATGTSTTGTGAGATTTTTNVIQITIGAAAVNTVTLRANPGSVPPGGGSVELIANVVAENGRALEGILVTFNTDQGTLSSAVATTNSSGEARTSLTAGQKASVTATAGTKTSTAVVVDIRVGPGITITCTPAAGTGNCAAVQASSSGNTATLVFTVSKGASTSSLRSATIDFGDSTSQSLGNLAGGNAIVTHTYTGPSSTAPRSYTATVTAVDINAETASASTAVNITPRVTPSAMSVVLTTTEGTAAAGTKTTTTVRWTFSAAVTGGGDGGTGNAVIESYAWDFGDGTTTTTNSAQTSRVYTKSGREGATTVTVTPRTADGRTVTAREEIIVAYVP